MYKIGNIGKCIREKTPSVHLSFQNGTIVLAILLLSTFGTDTATIPKKVQAMKYLSKFGYLPSDVENPTYESTVDASKVTEDIKDFQTFVGASVTGELDEETVQFMSLPRCGVRDKVDSGTENNRSKRYVTYNASWPRRTLTYNISKYTEKLNREDVDAEISKALQMWSNYADLTFIAKENGPDVDIEIKFVEGDHGDGFKFDGSGGNGIPNVLAHAFPPTKGDTHFDDFEEWTIGSKDGTNLLQIATHEFGHSLGLNHSETISSVMAPVYRGYDPNLRLYPDDIMGIQKLYGIQKNRSNAGDYNPCQGLKIDTLFNSTDSHLYAFKGQMYYQIEEYTHVPGYPKKISERWPNLPGEIDAAFTHKDNKTYFFKGTNYWRYSGQQVDSGYPKAISQGFPGVPNHLDTALAFLGNTKIYFFKGTFVWLFDTLARKVMLTYPKPISKKWKRLPVDLDAAIQRTNGYIAFIKGDRFYRMTNNSFSVDEKYPRSSGDYLFDCKIPLAL